MGAHAAAPHQRECTCCVVGGSVPFFVSMSAYDIHCARPRAKITENLMFPMCHSMREVSRLKLQFVPEHYIHFKIFRCTIIEIYLLLDPFLSRHPDDGTKLRV